MALRVTELWELTINWSEMRGRIENRTKGRRKYTLTVTKKIWVYEASDDNTMGIICTPI